MYNIPLGLDATELLKGFREAAENLDKLNAKAKETGAAMSSNLGKGASGSEDMNKSLKNVAGNLQNVKTVAGSLGDSINGLGARSRAAFDDKPVSLFRQRLEDARNRLQSLAGAVVSFGKGAREGFQGAVREARNMDKSIDELNKDIDLLRAKMNSTKDSAMLRAYGRQIQGMEAQVKKLTQSTDGPGGGSGGGGGLAGALGKVARVAVAAFAVERVVAFGKKVFDVRSQFQQLEVTFQTMLGSKEKADELMMEISEFAAKTPFSLQDVANGTKQLLAYGFAQDEVIDQMRTLGDVASGVGAPIGDLIYLFGTLKTSGRVTMMDINQFAGRGIPIYKELAKVLNTTEGNVRGMVSAGKVGFKEVEQAFKNMSKEGGQFGGLMDKQSKTLAGQAANIGDNVDRLMNNIGKNAEGIFSQALGYVNDFVSFMNGVVTGDVPGWLQPFIDLFQNIYERVERVVAAIVEWVQTSGIIKEVEEYITDLGAAMGVIIDVAWGIVEGIYAFADTIGVVDFITKSFRIMWDVLRGFVKTVAELPAIWEGVKAAVSQAVDNMIGRFKIMLNSLEEVRLKVKLAFTFDDDKEAALKTQLNALANENEQIKAKRKTPGQAFNEAYLAAKAEEDARQKAKDEAEKKEEAKVKKATATKTGGAPTSGEKKTKYDNSIIKSVNDDLIDLARKVRGEQLDAIQSDVDREKAKMIEDLNNTKADLLAKAGMTDKEKKARAGLNEADKKKLDDAVAERVRMTNELIEQMQENHNIRMKEIDKKAADEKIALQDEARQTILSLQEESLEGELELIQLDFKKRRKQVEEEYAKETELRVALIKALDDAEERAKKEAILNNTNERLEAEEKSAIESIELIYETGRKTRKAEETKQLGILEVSLHYAKLRLEALKAAGKSEEDEAVRSANAVISSLEGAIEQAKQSSKVGKDVFDLLGFDLTDQEKGQIKDSFSTIFSSVQYMLEESLNAEMEASQRRIDMYNEELDALQSRLDEEKSLKDAGLANDYDRLSKEIEGKKKKRDEEIRQQEEIQRKQARMQQLQIAANGIAQASNIALAAAEVFKAHSGIPFVGVLMAAAFVATILSTMAAVKSKAREASKMALGGPIGGKTHQQGGKKYYSQDGDGYELEQGEFVMRRDEASRYAPLLEVMNNGKIRKMGKDSLRTMLDNMGITLRTDIRSQAVEPAKVHLNMNTIGDKHLKSIDENIAYMTNRTRNKEEITETKTHTVFTKGNVVTKIRK